MSLTRKLVIKRQLHHSRNLQTVHIFSLVASINLLRSLTLNCFLWILTFLSNSLSFLVFYWLISPQFNSYGTSDHWNLSKPIRPNALLMQLRCLRFSIMYVLLALSIILYIILLGFCLCTFKMILWICMHVHTIISVHSQNCCICLLE